MGAPMTLPYKEIDSPDLLYIPMINDAAYLTFCRERGCTVKWDVDRANHQLQVGHTEPGVDVVAGYVSNNPEADIRIDEREPRGDILRQLAHRLNADHEYWSRE